VAGSLTRGRQRQGGSGFGAPKGRWDPAAGGRGVGGWKMTPGLNLGRKRHSRIDAVFGVGTGPPKGAKLAKPSSTPPDSFGTVEQRNGWSASVGALFRCSAVSGEWHPPPLRLGNRSCRGHGVSQRQAGNTARLGAVRPRTLSREFPQPLLRAEGSQPPKYRAPYQPRQHIRHP